MLAGRRVLPDEAPFLEGVSVYFRPPGVLARPPWQEEPQLRDSAGLAPDFAVAGRETLAGPHLPYGPTGFNLGAHMGTGLLAAYFRWSRSAFVSDDGTWRTTG